MENRHLIAAAVVALTLSTTPSQAQTDDFGFWEELNVEKKIGQKLSIEGGLEFRSKDHAKEIDRWSAGADVSYKLTDWLKIGAGYSLLYDHNVKERNTVELTSTSKRPKAEYRFADYWGTRHRFNVTLAFSKDFGKLGLSLRERWQYTYRPEKTACREYEDTKYGFETAMTDDQKASLVSQIEAGEATKTQLDELCSQGLLYLDEEEEGIEDHIYSGKGKNVWRNRLQLKYKVNKMWRPFVNAETFVSGSGLDKIRYAAGAEIRLAKQHWLDLKYIMQKSYKDDDAEGNRHILGIGYTYKF